MPPELLTVAEVARICRVHEMTIRRHIAQGRLRSIRVGRQIRVTAEAVEEYQEPLVQPGANAWILTEDDPFWELVGSVDSPETAGMSRDKYAYRLTPEGKRSRQQ